MFASVAKIEKIGVLIVSWNETVMNISYNTNNSTNYGNLVDSLRRLITNVYFICSSESDADAPGFVLHHLVSVLTSYCWYTARSATFAGNLSIN